MYICMYTHTFLHILCVYICISLSFSLYMYIYIYISPPHSPANPAFSNGRLGRQAPRRSRWSGPTEDFDDLGPFNEALDETESLGRRDWDGGT